MRITPVRLCLLLTALLVLILPAASAQDCQDKQQVPPDAVWMDVIYRSYDQDEVQVTQLLTKSPGVSLREGPSAAAKKIRGIPADTVLKVINHVPGWYCVRYQGETGYVNDSSEFVLILSAVTPVPATPTPTPVVTPTPKPATPTPNRNPYVMETPALSGRVFQTGEMNMAVFWVQTQLKATGLWYQEDGCSVTGCLDEATMSAVSEFMAANGFPEHGGTVDQAVIDELTDYLGSWVVAVYTGGFYDAMDVLMDGGPAGSMTPVGNAASGAVSSGVKVQWVQTCLQFLGYYSGSISGEYDEATANAVRLFQRDNGFAEEDRVNLGVARAMAEAFYYNRGNLSLLTGE